MPRDGIERAAGRRRELQGLAHRREYPQPIVDRVADGSSRATNHGRRVGESSNDVRGSPWPVARDRSARLMRAWMPSHQRVGEHDRPQRQEPGSARTACE